MSAPPGLEEAFARSRRHLWGLCYRMTGCAADADELVQETFARALRVPPVDLDRPWDPWLVRVALNLSRDHLRWRRLRYCGPFLPAPLDEAAIEAAADDGRAKGDRYETIETLSMAFLVALETLTPRQRAVLVVRDVLDYSVDETAELLDMSAANVKTTLHRARRELDRARTSGRAGATAPRAAALAQAAAVLGRMVQALTTGDAQAFAELLAEDVRALSDGGGEFSAAMVPVVGRARVCALYLGITKHSRPTNARLCTLGGLASIVLDLTPGNRRAAPRATVSIALDDAGRIASIYTVLASRKLSRVAPTADAADAPIRDLARI